MFLPHVVHFALVALIQSAPAAPPSTWIEVDLPVGFSLDLASGAVLSRPPSEEGTLVYADGLLRAIPRLGRWEGSTAERVSARVVRGAGVPVDQPRAVEGDEFLFDLDDGSWGYLHVRRAGIESVRLEYARADPASGSLVRDPRDVTVSSGSGGLELYWTATEPDSEYEIWRTIVGRNGAPERLARVAGSSFVDELAPPGLPVEYRVHRVENGSSFGARVRALDAANPPEWPIPIERGMFIDLLSGELGGENSHIEIAYASETHLNLRPMDGVLVARMTRTGESSSWVLPDPDSGSYQSKLFSAQVGEDLAVKLPGPVYVRLRFTVDAEAHEVTMRRQLDLDGTRLLALAPGEVEVGWSNSGPSMTLPPLDADVPDRESVMIIVERELAYASDNWEEFKLGVPGDRKLHLPLSEEIRSAGHIGRFRLRHAYPWGVRSLPGDPIRVPFGDLTDAGTRANLLEAGLRDLVDDRYERRIAARGLLEDLGPEAWPRLREALESEDPELAGAARDILLAADASRSDHVAYVLKAQAEADGVEELPEGWLDPDVDLRALGVLRTWRQARAARAESEEVADPDPLADGLRVLVRAEPDEGLRRLAIQLLEQLHLSPAPRAFNGARRDLPFALSRPDQRPVARQSDWAELLGSPVTTDAEVAAAIEAATDLTHPRAGLVMLQMAQRWLRAPDLEGDPMGDAVRRELREMLELGLRLSKRASDTSSSSLLDAAEELVFDPAARLVAMAELMELRMGRGPDQGSLADDQRRRIELEEPTMANFVDTLDRLKADGESYLDVVLPAGDYSAMANEAWIDLSVEGLRLVGGEGVRLSVGLRIVGVSDVVLSGLIIDNGRGAAVTVVNGSASLFDCELLGADTGVTVQSGQVEVYGSDFRRRTQGRMSNWSLRMSGAGSQLYARESVFRAGSVFPGSGSLAIFESCVLDGQERATLQGQDSSRAILRDCLVRGESSGILNFSDLQLEGVVFDVAAKPLTLTGGGAYLCPKHVVFLQIEDPLSLPQQLGSCPLERQR